MKRRFADEVLDCFKAWKDSHGSNQREAFYQKLRDILKVQPDQPVVIAPGGRYPDDKDGSHEATAYWRARQRFEQLNSALQERTNEWRQRPRIDSSDAS